MSQLLERKVTMEEIPVVITRPVCVLGDNRATVNIYCTVKASKLIWFDKIEKRKKTTAIQTLEDKNKIILQ